jgi:hypothetical protein
MNLFAESDRRNLVAPPSLFDREALREEHGDWGHQLLRAATAMEMLAQITNRELRYFPTDVSSGAEASL